MEDRAVAKELDEWISQLRDCKQLEETQVKALCEKVRGAADIPTYPVVYILWLGLKFEGMKTML